MENRRAIYNKDHDKRVISTENGTWTPQRRVSHTPGCKRGYRWIQVDKDYGYREMDTAAPHFDPWQDIHAPVDDKEHALISAFGPAYINQIV
jgi:hypothetical protein